MKKYVLTRTTYYMDKESTFYGVALIESSKGKHELVATFNDLTDNIAKAQQTVEYCNSANLCSCHFEDVIQDMMAE